MPIDWAWVLCDLLYLKFSTGILTQEVSDPSLRPYGGTYIPSSYVKYIESGGARVIPIRYRKGRSYLSQTSAWCGILSCWRDLTHLILTHLILTHLIWFISSSPCSFQIRELSGTSCVYESALAAETIRISRYKEFLKVRGSTQWQTLTFYPKCNIMWKNPCFRWDLNLVLI